MKQQTVANILKVVLVIATAAFIISMSSCSPSGYGCKGRSKYITGHRPNGYGY